MRRRYYVGLVMTIVLIIAVLFYGVKSLFALHPHYSLAQKRPVYSILRHNDDTLRIICIGDSWAHIQRLYDNEMSKMVEERIGVKTKVTSIGLPGQTSKEVYNNLFNNSQIKQLIVSGANYCIISVGINDAIQKLGENYYVYHTCLIIDFMLENGIHPILLEIPNFNILKVFMEQDNNGRLFNYISMYVSGSSIDCLQDYRDAMSSYFLSNYTNTVSFLRYKMWNDQRGNSIERIYQPDGIHLNSLGYQLLDSAIVSLIQNHKCI